MCNMPTCQLSVTLLCCLTLVSCGGRAADELVERLKTRDTEELHEVTGKLVRLPNAMAVPALRRGLGSDKWRTRYMSAQLLGRFGAPEAVPDLLQALEDSVGGVRAQAAGALGRLSARSAVPRLVTLLDDDSEVLQIAAAEALAAIGAAQALPALLRLSQVRDLTLRTSAIRALGPCASDSSATNPTEMAPDLDSLRRQARRSIQTALDDDLARVRIAGIVSLRGTSYRGSVTELLRLADDRSAEVQHVAVQALGEITSLSHPAWQGHPAPAMGLITDVLDHKATAATNDAVRRRAVEALARIAADGAAVGATVSPSQQAAAHQ